MRSNSPNHGVMQLQSCCMIVQQDCAYYQKHINFSKIPANRLTRMLDGNHSHEQGGIRTGYSTADLHTKNQFIENTEFNKPVRTAFEKDFDSVEEEAISNSL